MDYRNRLGEGHTALYLSSPQRQYYHLVSRSLEQWLSSHISYLRRGFYQQDQVGKEDHQQRISTFLNVKKIYEETKQPEKGKAHPDFPFISYEQHNDVSISMQSKYETLKSNVFPEGYPTPSELFFVIQMRLELTNPSNSYHVLKFCYRLNFSDGSSSDFEKRFGLASAYESH